MINKSNKMMFFSILFISVIISISANSWFSIWMGMEINIMAFLPIMLEQKELTSKEAALTYFIVQTIASMLMLMSIIIMMINNNLLNSISIFYFNNMMLLSSLMIKAGISPFHFWLPKMMEGLNWNKCLILMTWQKIMPMVIMSSIITINFVSIMGMMMSLIIGSLGAFNQTSIRKLMAYSSISNNSWMMMAMLISEMMWLVYFIFYSIITMVMTKYMNLYNIYYMNQITSMNENKMMKFIIMMNTMSMSGLPPLLGFMPKWMVIQLSMSNMEIMIMSIMIVMSLVMTYNYLRMFFTTMMLSNSETKWNIKKSIKINKISFVATTMSILGLSMITTIVSL